MKARFISTIFPEYDYVFRDFVNYTIRLGAMNSNVTSDFSQYYSALLDPFSFFCPF